jgi:two-component system nitrate/nitrite response regulator NarP
MSIRIILADDHPLIRSGISRELATIHEFEVVGQATTGDQALALTQSLTPDILLLDINMPGIKSIKVIKTIKDDRLKTKVIVLTAYNDIAIVAAMVRAGASGYILKDDDPSVIPTAIFEVNMGNFWISEGVANYIDIIKENPDAVGKPLSDREKEVLEGITAGLTNKEIALKLQTKERTIEFHVSNIFMKLCVKSRAEAAAFVSDKHHMI